MAKPQSPPDVCPVGGRIRSIKFHVTDIGIVATVKTVGPVASSKVRLHARTMEDMVEKLSRALLRNGVALG